MRALLALSAALLLAPPAPAATVQLRDKANGNVIEVEVVEVRADQVAFRLPGGERVYTKDWDDLDTAWIRRNSPALWAERELLLKPAETKPKDDAGKAADPFAKETPPADTKAILRNLAAALADRTRGIDPGRIDDFCRNQAKIDEDSFWKAYDDMRRSATGATPDPKADTSSSRSRERSDRKDRGEWERNPAHRYKEDVLREQLERGRGGLTYLAYLQALAEGGSKGRVAWQLLRSLAEDRKAILDRLQKYEKQAAELAERAEQPDARRDALVLRKAIADLLASLGRVSRENPTQEERLRMDASGLLSRLAAGK